MCCYLPVVPLYIGHVHPVKGVLTEVPYSIRLDLIGWSFVVPAGTNLIERIADARKKSQQCVFFLVERFCVEIEFLIDGQKKK